MVTSEERGKDFCPWMIADQNISFQGKGVLRPEKIFLSSEE